MSITKFILKYLIAILKKWSQLKYISLNITNLLQKQTKEWYFKYNHMPTDFVGKELWKFYNKNHTIITVKNLPL